MKADLEVPIGAKVRYDCPLRSNESFQADHFFAKHRGKIATIVDFATEYVGILDTQGRLPGTYYDPDGIVVQFDDEDEHHTLNILHFTLLSPAKVVQDASLSTQRCGDLPESIRFYPGDGVCLQDDLLQVERSVQRVSVDQEGGVTYHIAETEESRDSREQEDQRRKEEAKVKGQPFLPIMSSLSAPHSDKHSVDELKLLVPRNLHWLYEDPDRMHFLLPIEEYLFWTLDGLSRTVFHRNAGIPAWRHTEEDAWELFESGAADLILHEQETPGLTRSDREGNFVTRKLLDRFQEHRDNVRSVMRELGVPIQNPRRLLEELIHGPTE